MEAFLKELETESGGRVKFTFYPGETLLKGNQLYEGAATGIIDVAMTGLHYTPGRFPSMDALYQPFGFPSGWSATQVANDYYEKFRFEEFNDTHPLFFHASGRLCFYTKKAVRTLPDLTGMTLRCGSASNNVLLALGAVPNNMGMPDVGESIGRGLLDGVFMGADGLITWRFGDVVKYITFPMIGGCDVFVVTMSNSSWNKLPSDVQEVFNDVSAKYADEAAEMWGGLNNADYALGKDLGIDYITLSAAEKARWKAAVAEVIDAYVDARVAAGESRSEVEEWVKYIEERTEYWSEEELKTPYAFPG